MSNDLARAHRSRLGRARNAGRPPPRARCAMRWKRRWTAWIMARCAWPKRSTANGIVHQWLKKAVLLSFRLNDMKLIAGAPGGADWWDKVDSKFLGWDEARFRAAGFRAVPGAIVRRSAFIAKGVVLMPSFVNVGAHVGEGTMIDTWATVGSCAQVGAHCHISGGAGIGGVLEPLQAAPTIIEDNCFIGARAEVAEGVIVGEGSVLSMGVYLVRLDQDRRPRHAAKSSWAACRPIRWWCRARMPSGERALALLRRDRQAGGRKDPRQDLDQRIAAGLMSRDRSGRPGPGPDPLPFGDAGGCGRAGRAGSGAEGARLRLPSPALREAAPGGRKSLCAAGHGAPAFLLCRPHRCGAAGRQAGRTIPSPPRSRTACFMAAAPPT